MPYAARRRERIAVAVLVAVPALLATGVGVPLGLAAWGFVLALALDRNQRGVRNVLARVRQVWPKQVNGRLRFGAHPIAVGTAAAIATWASFMLFLVRPPLPWWHSPTAHVAGLAAGSLLLWPLVLAAVPIPRVARATWREAVERWGFSAVAIGGAAGGGLAWQLATAHPVASSLAPGLLHISLPAAVFAGVLTAIAVGGFVLVMIATGGLGLARRAPADEDTLRWMQAWQAAGLVRNGVAPKLLGKRPGDLGTTVWRWSVPPGLSDDDLRRKLGSMKHALGTGYLVIDNGSHPGEWHLVAAPEAPLIGTTFPWADWASPVLKRDAQLASAGTLGFVAGVGHTGELVVHDFGNGDAPHLLIAGQSGSGKSVVLTSALMQLVQTYSPDDLVLTLLDPKGELKPFVAFGQGPATHCLPHVQAYLSDKTPGSPYENALHLVAPLVAEVENRMTSFSALRGSPRNLVEARAAGSHIPWHLVVMEEAADYLGAKVSRPDKDARDGLERAVAELARKARSAGILLLLVTQYPTKEAMPVQIKQQCSRLALKMANQDGSKAILGHGGAERLAGMGHAILSVGGREVELRGFSVSTEERDAAIRDALDRWGPRAAPLVTPAGGDDHSELPSPK